MTRLQQEERKSYDADFQTLKTKATALFSEDHNYSIFMQTRCTTANQAWYTASHELAWFKLNLIRVGKESAKKKLQNCKH